MALFNTYDPPTKIRKILTLSYSNWDEFTQTVQVPILDADDVVLIKPVRKYESLWISNRVYCSGQDDGELSFVCSVYPKDDIRVEAVIIKGGISKEQNIGRITLDKTSINVGIDNASETITATVVGDGELSVECDSDVISISRNGNYVTVTPVQQDLAGSAKIYFYLSDTEAYCGAKAEVDVSVSWVNVYGVYWDGGADPSMVRTDDAAGFADPVPAVSNGNGSSSFDELMPWAGMKRSTDANAGVVVSIPKFYYKWTRDGASMKLQIADGYKKGFYVSPAHADRGDGYGERDVVYVGAYNCASSNYKSVTGVAPKGGEGNTALYNGIHNLGNSVWMWDYATYMTICILYLVEYANWDSQNKIGYGCGNNSYVENTGFCDAMTYHTGTNAANRTTYGHVRYRWIEDMWANTNDLVLGIYGASGSLYCIKNPSKFLDYTSGIRIGSTYDTSFTSGYFVKSWRDSNVDGFEYVLIPESVTSSISYTNGRFYTNSSGNFRLVNIGGFWNNEVGDGIFCIGMDNDVDVHSDSGVSARMGTRLMILPNS